MSVGRFLQRGAALVLPLALVLTAGGVASAAKPGTTPKPTVTSKPAAVSNLRTATFAWTKVTNTNYHCQLDGGTIASCASPKTYNGLADGSHTFVLRAKTGNLRASNWSYTWTVDTTPPPAPNVGAVPSPTTSTSVAVAFSSTQPGVVFRCALDGAAATACTSPLHRSGLAEGAHSLAVRSLEASGNVSAPTVRTWVIDLTAPSAPQVTAPPSPTRSQGAVITFSSTDPSTASLTCSLDGEPATSCTSPMSFSDLALGEHLFSVTATDAVGNSATRSVGWVIDQTPPPVPSLVSGPANTTSASAVSIAFGNAESLVTFTCALDGAAPTSCASPWTGDVTGNGPHALDVVAVDLAGNASAPLTVSWTRDASSLSPVSLTGPGAFSSGTDPSFTFVLADGTTAQCRIDNGPWLACTSPITASNLNGGPLGEGVHTVQVQAVDTLGQVVGEPMTHTWTVDLTAPTTAPVPPPGVTLTSGLVTAAPSLVFGSSDPEVAGYVCAMDGGAWVSCVSGFTPAAGQGSHTVLVATVDQAGNIGPSITYTWTLDSVAPLATVSFPSALNGSVAGTFGEVVRGVSPASVQLRLAGTTTAVPTRQVCASATGVAVACSGSAVRKVTLTPSSRLVPGQKYTVAIAATVTDAAGNARSYTARTHRAATSVQDTDLAIGQAWRSVAASTALGGRYVVANFGGASASYAFRGTGITWYTVKGPNQGTAKVYCGTVYKGTVNNYASTATWRVPRAVSCSTATANNVLKIVPTGLRGSTKGTGTYVVVDAVRVGSTTATNPALTMRWRSVAATAASAGRYAVARLSGDAAQMRFRGTSVSWYTAMGASMGKANVYLDGVLVATVDNYSSTTRYGVRRTFSAIKGVRLTDGLHTLRIVATGTHRSVAKGNLVAIDLLRVG